MSPSKDVVADFLRTIILDADKDVDIINKALECVSSWAQIRAFEILQYPGLIESLLKKIDSEQTVFCAVEVKFCEKRCKKKSNRQFAKG